MCTIKQVEELMLLSGHGRLDCMKALKACKGDIELANGYLKLLGLAICVKRVNGVPVCLNKAQAYLKRHGLLEGK